MSAAAFARFLNNGQRRIALIESDEIGTIGVGEATIPPILNFNKMLGIPENEFLKATQGTFKLGIEFVNWGKLGERYLHPFGHFGHDLQGIDFHQLWLREYQRGTAYPIGDYSMNSQTTANGKFARPAPHAPVPFSELLYAFHFDASLYARYLRGFAERHGVLRREGRIVQVHRNGNTGFVEAVELAGGERVEGQLFIDCSGQRALLIDGALETRFEDWSHWLPMDSAIALPTTNVGSPDPFTRSTAHEAGWQWRIPLQHRTGNGHVYCSQHISDDEAAAKLLANVAGEPLSDPRLIRFRVGRRKQPWNFNVVAIGLSSGFLEPLESTAIHLIQNAITRLFALFPDTSFSPLERAEYNKGMAALYEDIRDFIILHYKATQRDDTAFWRGAQDMDIPESLANRMELFLSRGRIFRENAELFGVASWVAVMLGQNMIPRAYDTLVDALDEDKVIKAMQQMRASYRQTAQAMPDQESFLRKCGAWATADEMIAAQGMSA